MKCLDELNYGVAEGLSEVQFKEKFSDAYQNHLEKSLTYRYPQGESYQDLIARIEPVIFEIERTQSPVIVIAHNCVLRCLYSYFSQNFSQNQMDNIPKIYIQKETVIKLIPDVYFCREERSEFDVPNSTYRINKNKIEPKSILKSDSFQNKSLSGIGLGGITKKSSFLDLDSIKTSINDRHQNLEDDGESSDTRIINSKSFKSDSKDKGLRKITEQYDNLD